MFPESWLLVLKKKYGISVLGGEKLDEIVTFVWKIQTKEVWQV
jgi:hypothetical protein